MLVAGINLINFNDQNKIKTKKNFKQTVQNFMISAISMELIV